MAIALHQYLDVRLTAIVVRTSRPVVEEMYLPTMPAFGADIVTAINSWILRQHIFM